MLTAATSDTGRSDILDLATRRLQWLDARQQVLATNVANSDTPGYRPRDVSAFETQLSRFSITPAITNPAHLSGSTTNATGTVRTIDHERAPDGNAISLQQQLTEIADNDSQQRTATGLYSKIMQLYNTALDK